MANKDKGVTRSRHQQRQAKDNGGMTSIGDILEEKGIVSDGKLSQDAFQQKPNPGRDLQTTYEEFFSLYADFLKRKDRCSLKTGLNGEGKGTCFLPLGFIPGPAVILNFDESGIKVVAGTADVRKELGVPTEWSEFNSLPGKLKDAINEQISLIHGLNGYLSPWEAGLAGKLLGKGREPTKYLSMGFTKFSWKGQEQPFGVLLQPTEGTSALEVKAVYNPGGKIQAAPKVNDSFPVVELRERKETPLIKLIRTWAKMEASAQQQIANKEKTL